MKSAILVFLIPLVVSRPVVPGEALVQLAAEVADTPAQMEAGVVQPKIQFDMNAPPKVDGAMVDDGVMPRAKATFDMNESDKGAPQNTATTAHAFDMNKNSEPVSGPLSQPLTPDEMGSVAFVSIPVEESEGDMLEAEMASHGSRAGMSMSPSLVMPETVAHGATAESMEPVGRNAVPALYDDDEPVSFNMNGQGGQRAANRASVLDAMNRVPERHTRDMMNAKVAGASMRAMNEESGSKDMVGKKRVQAAVYTAPTAGPDAMQVIAGQGKGQLDMFDDQGEDDGEDAAQKQVMPEALSNQSLADKMEENVKVTQVPDPNMF